MRQSLRNHPGAAYTGETDLWVVDRTGSGWSEPRHLGWTVNSDKWDRGPCTSASGNLYFSSERDGGYGRSDIYRAEWVDAIDKDKMKWINVGDMKGSTTATVTFNVPSIPFNYLLDKEGTVVARNLQGPALDKAIGNLLK